MELKVENSANGQVTLHFVKDLQGQLQQAKSFCATPEMFKEIIEKGWDNVLVKQVNGGFDTAPDRVLLDTCVFPSNEPSIVCIITDEKFDGAHDYEIKPMLRFQPEYQYDFAAIEDLFRKEMKFLHMQALVEEHQGVIKGNEHTAEMIKKCVDLGYIKQIGGHTVYGLEGMPLTFVKRLPNGTFRPGLQTEQLLLVIEDRHPKLNAEFPAEEHDEFMYHIRAARECLERRFRKRLDRGVAGEHKA